MTIYFVITLSYLVKLSLAFSININELNRLFSVITNSSTQYASFSNDTDSVPDTITKAGYKVEEHIVTTEDGYILKMHRIPCGKIGCKNNKTRKPILCVHGLFASSSSFILRGPDHSLGFVLADAGYDVWLGNTRGSIYSRNHLTFSKESMKFWKFSFQEKGIYDLPAMIDYILKNSRHSKLAYIGHSEGTTNLYVLLSVRPEYNKKISIGFMLSPVVHIKHSRIPLLDMLANLAQFIASIYRHMGKGEFVSLSELLIKYQKLICRETTVLKILCIFPFALLLGFEMENFEPKAFNLFLTNAQGVSIMEMLHYLQLYKTGEFKWYDYGYLENLAKYNSVTPPLYNLCKITVPTILFYSDNDLVISYADVNKLNSDLRKSAKIIIEDDSISHLDFLMGKTAKKHIYDTILEILKSNMQFPEKVSANCKNDVVSITPTSSVLELGSQKSLN